MGKGPGTKGKAHYAEYRVNNTRDARKLKRVRQSSGLVAAKLYATLKHLPEPKK